jgi:hypothetical protein
MLIKQLNYVSLLWLLQINIVATGSDEKSEHCRAGLSLVKNLPAEKKGMTFFQNEVIDFGLVT